MVCPLKFFAQKKLLFPPRLNTHTNSTSRLGYNQRSVACDPTSHGFLYTDDVLWLLRSHQPSPREGKGGWLATFEPLYDPIVSFVL